MLKLAEEELQMNRQLEAEGDVSRAEVLRLQRSVADIRAQMVNKKNKYFQDAQAELSKAEEDYAGILQNLTQKREQLDRVELKSPMTGTVKNVKITTLGGVIKSGEEVMQIVPDGDALMVEVKVKPADIAFIKPGLYAIVKIDAYDYSIYGTLNGKVSFISPDTLTEETKGADQTYYRVQILTDGKGFSSSKKNLEIQPGMTARAEIITGKNTVLSYLIKPITKTLKESLTER
jgi:adhesin transport system membrane fusion protein